MMQVGYLRMKQIHTIVFIFETPYLINQWLVIILYDLDINEYSI